ncbi:synaptic plasticity regulator PANTS isoform X2 [Muntiacus reevesi]|uniref:synaptic plasticity regulator PANTS isoform X2 n=1 Tax=Muntiacus reevesi TaxID=9886 RepID=UPI00330759E7
MAEGEGWRPPRPCEAYRAEWELCRSAGHFLRHYYVHGERPACGQWRRDLASCREWEERRSAEAQVRPGDPTGPAEPWKAGNQRRWAQGAGLEQGLRVQPSACALTCILQRWRR